jgi:hypothetical protein
MASKNTFSCPACGEDVPAKAKACPHCGACEKSGWNEEASAGDGLDLPDEEFDYEKFTEEEFGTPRKLRGKERFWKVVAVVVLVLMFILFAANFLFR